MLLQTVGDQTELERYGPYGHFLRELGRRRLYLAVSNDMQFIIRGVKVSLKLSRVNRIEGESEVNFQRKETTIISSQPMR